jgi:hypothetical protein
MNFWKTLGKGLAHLAVYAGKAALWASQHPEVVAIVSQAAHIPPAVTQIIEVAGALQQQK